MKEIVSEHFWDFLQAKASDNDAWWLDGWLDDRLKEYKEITPCPKCQSRIVNHVYVWSKTRNHVLEDQWKCECEHLRDTIDRREYLRKALVAGEVKQKDVKILQEELKEKLP